MRLDAGEENKAPPVTVVKVGFSAKAVVEDLVEGPSGQKGDLVVMVCNVLRER